MKVCVTSTEQMAEGYLVVLLVMDTVQILISSLCNCTLHLMRIYIACCAYQACQVTSTQLLQTALLEGSSYMQGAMHLL